MRRTKYYGVNTVDYTEKSAVFCIQYSQEKTDIQQQWYTGFCIPWSKGDFCVNNALLFYAQTIIENLVPQDGSHLYLFYLNTPVTEIIQCGIKNLRTI